jgi:holo-[acyl-carrier protein] synthase
MINHTAHRGIGIDIIEIARIEQAISRWQTSFLKRVYTPAEIDHYHKMRSLAARFAAKEAVMKALGTGTKGLHWKDIEILSDNDGAPFVQLYGKAHQKSQEAGIRGFSVSLSHSKEYATAIVIGNVI